MSLISFADRDLFMWHRGGGVRHHEFKPAETIKITTEEIEEEEAEDPDVQPKEENEEELEHEMIDYGYEEDNDDEEEDEKADEVEEEQGATKEIGTQMEDEIADALKGLGLNINEDGGMEVMMMMSSLIIITTLIVTTANIGINYTYLHTARTTKGNNEVGHSHNMRTYDLI